MTRDTAPSPPAVTTAPLAAGRGLVTDVATLALGIPLFPVDRTMRLDAVVAARAAAATRIGWAAIFLKAYGRVVDEMPILRSWLAGHVRHRLATSGGSMAVVAVNRVEQGEDRLCFGRLYWTGTKTLPFLQHGIERFATGPLDHVFERQLQLESAPGPLRRAILRWNMRSTSPKRLKRVGTFSLSTLAGFQATNRFHPTLCTTSLSYAPLESDGRCVVTLIADHRVLDGAVVARALARLEQVLQTEIVAELTALRDPVHALPEAAA